MVKVRVGGDEDRDKMLGSEMESVDRYRDLVPKATNGVVALEEAMVKFSRENGGTSFVQACVDKTVSLAEGDLKGSVAGMLKILDKIVPDLKSTELKVGGMGVGERLELAKELSRGIVDGGK